MPRLIATPTYANVGVAQSLPSGLVQWYYEYATVGEFKMAAVSDPELSDDGTDEPEPDVPCTSAAVAVDHESVPSLLTRLKQAPVAAVNRKRKVAQNSSTRQRHKTPRTTHDPKGVSPEQ